MAKDDERAPIEGVEVRETGRGKFQVEVRTASGLLLADEPAAAGGLGSGATPYDLLAAALGACTAMTLRLYADRKGWPLRSALVRVAHRSQGLEVKDRFAREIVLEGELAAEQKQRLLEIAERCPVHKTLTRGSEIVSVLADNREPCALEPEPLDHASDMLELVEDY
ncbi:OsmC family protein [Phenylobacterium sp.]|uniref:OsmC family protein n=1 Tax=Phenylobacterium sp. TaxID=1871053 RepID=UPI00261D5BAA|nr:OsmC family protein [Phenylobacterium sp.]